MSNEENKLGHLEILCEIPLKVTIGDRDFEIRPLVPTKLVLMTPYLESIVNIGLDVIQDKFGGLSGLITAVSKDEVVEKDIVKLLLTSLSSNIEKAMECFKIVLRPKAKGEDIVDTEFLMDNLETSTMALIVGFLVQTMNIGEAVKNVRILKKVR